ncbi:uncharacterized protein LOC122370409 [Amphibalanus amphitrite]|uniref:uncharacterized protein LOC122367243 n=1 Tax=Amphibalanus amphitrite TaxID=1232801 RepID=UPI001C8FCA8B|nr:uncharacterized protein LOC122367243 [Amphibalanus amphitrite]XP_043201917.1 uncharacterized protein LOC122370409 [Amphibalanus amphitrite]
MSPSAGPEAVESESERAEESRTEVGRTEATGCPCGPPPGQQLAPEYRRWRRQHGLQAPLHGQQLAGWILLLAAAAFTAGVLVPALTAPLQIPAALLGVVLLLVHAISHAAATLVDPADGELRSRPGRHAVPEFDRQQHAHVIENGRCHLCNVTITSSRTKHCAACNKCVDRFDHHCKWLNHCVGRRNYVWFLVCVASAAALSLLVLTLAAAALALCFTSSGQTVVMRNDTQAPTPVANTTQLSQTGAAESLLKSPPPGDSGDGGNGDGDNGVAGSPLVTGAHLAMFGVPVEKALFAAGAGLFGTLALVAAVLLIHLLIFHAFLAARGATTYEYIRQLDSSHKSAPPSAESNRRWRHRGCCAPTDLTRRRRVRPGRAPPAPPIGHSEKQNGVSGPHPAECVVTVSGSVPLARAEGSLPALPPLRTASGLKDTLDTLQKYNDTRTQLPDSDSEGTEEGGSAAAVRTCAKVEAITPVANGNVRPAVTNGSQWLKQPATKADSPAQPESKKDRSPEATSPKNDVSSEPEAEKKEESPTEAKPSLLMANIVTVASQRPYSAPVPATRTSRPRELDLTVDLGAPSTDEGRFRVTPVTQFEPTPAPAPIGSPHITRTVGGMGAGMRRRQPSPVPEEPRKAKRVTFVEVTQVRRVECASDTEDCGDRVRDETRPLSAQNAVADYMQKVRARRRGHLAAGSEALVVPLAGSGASVEAPSTEGRPSKVWFSDGSSALGSVRT